MIARNVFPRNYLGGILAAPKLALGSSVQLAANSANRSLSR